MVYRYILACSAVFYLHLSFIQFLILNLFFSLIFSCFGLQGVFVLLLSYFEENITDVKVQTLTVFISYIQVKVKMPVCMKIMVFFFFLQFIEFFKNN